MHYTRWQKYGSPGDAALRCAPVGSGYINAGGYRQVYDREYSPDHGLIMEHRLVMSRFLGRELERHETVHHRNGNRLDNRLKNLELYIGNHGPGQRVQDQVRWAATILARYRAIARRLSALQDPGHEQLTLP